MIFEIGMLVSIDLDERGEPLSSSEDLTDALTACINENLHEFGGGARGTAEVMEIEAEAIDDDGLEEDATDDQAD